LIVVRTAAVVVSWEGGATTDRCVASLRAQDPPPDEVVVVDNASSAAERERLGAGEGREPRVRLLFLPENRQFAGGLNAGGREAFAHGAERVLFLNNDTVLAEEALRLLGAALDAHPGAGIAGPLVRYADAPARVLTAGEVHSLPLLCAPRSLLRPRRRGPAAYSVSGVMGCAMLVTRACFEAVGGYSRRSWCYEDVDFCVGARAAGFGLLIEPCAQVYHDGFRGFVQGLSPWAGFLKARNPWILMRRRAGLGSWLTFLPSYPLMIGASALLYYARGRGDIARALLRGAWAGVGVALGGTRRPVGAPR
jgi:GT2 family glycosyltransferase